MLIYHIAGKKFQDLRPLKLQTKGKERIEQMRRDSYSEDYLQEYITEINFFFGKPTLEQKERMVAEGFVNWNSKDTYVHTVNTDDIKRLNYNYVKITSTPQQREYDNLYWDDFIKKYKDVFNNGSNEEWGEVKQKYLDKREEYLLKRYGIKEKMDLNELTSHKQLSSWNNFNEHFEFNLKHGNKEQYASYIPHIQLSVSKPLIPLEVIKL